MWSGELPTLSWALIAAAMLFWILAPISKFKTSVYWKYGKFAADGVTNKKLWKKTQLSNLHEFFLLVFTFYNLSGLFYCTLFNTVWTSVIQDNNACMMRSSRVWMRSSREWMRSIRVWMRSSMQWMRFTVAQWLERLTPNANVNVTVVGSISASSGTVESEGWQIKQCWI